MTAATAPVAPGGLAGTAVRLRLALLRGSLRGGPGATGRRLGFAGGAVAGGLLAALALLGLSLSRGHGRLPADLSVVVFNALLAGWVVLPVLTFGSDDLLDPARLALLPLTRRQLLTVMGVGALVGVAPVATLVAALGLLPATGRGPLSYVVATLSAVLLLGLCVACSRATASGLSGLLRSRRGRDLGVVLAALVGLSFQLLNPLLQVGLRRGGIGEDALHGLAGPLRWTPPGLLAAAPGRPLPAALASLAGAAAVLGVVLVLWQRSVRHALETPDTTGSRRRRSTGLVPRGLPLPGGRVGAVAAKDLRYLTREPRRLVAAVVGALVPVLAVAFGPLLLAGSGLPRGLVFAVCGVGLLGGLNGGNRFGLDGTATWVLVGSATSPRDAGRDLLGGDLAAAVVTVPVLLLLTTGLAAVTSGWGYAPPALGVALALFAVSVALSGHLAVSAPFPVPQSQNAFSSGNAGQGFTAGLLTLGALGADLVLCLPLLALLVPWVLSPAHRAVLGPALLVLGPAYGVGVGALLRARAARQWAARGPEVLQVLSASRG